jgi:hypothetical protein
MPSADAGQRQHGVPMAPPPRDPALVILVVAGGALSTSPTDGEHGDHRIRPRLARKERSHINGRGQSRFGGVPSLDSSGRRELKHSSRPPAAGSSNDSNSEQRRGPVAAEAAGRSSTGDRW